MKPSNLLPLLQKNKWLIAGLAIILIISYFYLSKIFSLHFVDEEDNFVLGHFLISGQKLYSDLFSHHQPFAYLISAMLQLITTPQNIYNLIKLHREFMILYSIIWSAILIWKFREKIIIPLIIFELTKYYLLGQFFLSESLAVYPIIYSSLILFTKQNLKTLEFFILGLMVGYSAMLLAPLWPFLLAFLIFLYFFKKPNLKQISFLIIGVIISMLISLPFVNLYYYFHNAFYINFKYYIPQSGEERMPMNLIKSFVTPITAIINKSDFSSANSVIKFTAIFFFSGLLLLIKNKNFKYVTAIIVLLTLANFRYVNPTMQYFRGFHILIWYGLFITLSYYFFTAQIENFKNKQIKLTLTGFILIAVVVITYSSKDLFKKNDLDHDYYVNYSQQFAFGEAIKAMRNPEDALFVIPDEWLLYFQGDVKNFDRMVNFYNWMSLVWELNDPVAEKFKTNPPQFFYCDCDEKTVMTYSEDYHQMIRDGAKTPLWVLNSKFNSLNEEQKSKLRFFHFQLE